MLALRPTLLAAATLLSSIARADYVIDPNSVSLTIRSSWCASEISTCPLICEQTSTGGTLDNTCDPNTLTYGCVCGNGLQPNISEYSLTLPYFTCTQWGTQCVAACGSDNACSSACRQDHPCGALSPTRVNVTSSSTMATATATGTGTSSPTNTIYTGLDNSGASATTTAASSGALPPRFEAANLVGMISMIAGLAVGFSLFL